MPATVTILDSLGATQTVPTLPALGQALKAASLPVTIASDQALTVTGTIAAASTTSGQTGTVIFGAVTTANPVYTTGTSNFLSLTTAGLLRVDGSLVTQPVSGTVSVTN